MLGGTRGIEHEGREGRRGRERGTCYMSSASLSLSLSSTNSVETIDCPELGCNRGEECNDCDGGV